MEINLLTLNLGNSRLGMAAFVAGEFQPATRVGNDEQANWPGKLAEAWARVAGRENAAVVAASVNPALADALASAVRQAIGQSIEWVGKDIDLPVKVLTENPGQTGVDRVLNIAAAHEQLQKACVVVDAGTALTIDCCDDQGSFLGGAIAPGVSMMLDALHERTAQLPRVTMAVPAEPLGRSTEEAIRHGVYHGIRGMVKELVEAHAMELGEWPEIIATGGDAPLLFEGWELVHAISPDLTFYGIALAYAQHHIRHGT